MKYMLYARVSSRGSDFEGETSIEMQLQFCRDFIKAAHGEIVGELYDEFFSGKDTKRPAFQKILNSLADGDADWDVLIVYKLSRMTRSLKDGAAIFDTLYRHGKGFVSATEKLDFSSPSGRAMLGMMQVFSQFEREQTAENTRNKMMSIAHQGLWPVGNPPFGYRRGEKKDNKLYIDERKSAIVRDVFAMYVSTHEPYRSILSKYRDILFGSQIFRMLRCKAYLGIIEYGGKEFKGQHEPIISQELFDKVQAMLPQQKTQSRPKAQKYPYLLTGLIYCKCGQRMTPESAKSGDFNYYACRDKFTCKTRVSAPLVEDATKTYIRGLDFSPAKIEAVLAKLELMRKNEEHINAPEVMQLNKGIASCEKEKAAVVETIIEMRHKLTDDMLAALREKDEKLSHEIILLKTRLGSLSTASGAMENYKIAIDMVRKLENLSTAAHDELKMESSVLRQAVLANIGKIELTAEGDFKLTPSSSNETEWLAIQKLAELLKLRFRVVGDWKRGSLKKRNRELRHAKARHQECESP